MKIDSPFNVEPEYLYPKVVLSLNSLLPRIELLSLVDVLAASVTSPVRVSEGV